MESPPLPESSTELVNRLSSLVANLERHDRRQDALLSCEDAAHLLGVSVRKVRRYASSGELPVVDLGGAVRIHPKTLDAFIRERVRGGRR